MTSKPYYAAEYFVPYEGWEGHYFDTFPEAKASYDAMKAGKEWPHSHGFMHKLRLIKGWQEHVYEEYNPSPTGEVE